MNGKAKRLLAILITGISFLSLTSQAFAVVINPSKSAPICKMCQDEGVELYPQDYFMDSTNFPVKDAFGVDSIAGYTTCFQTKPGRIWLGLGKVDYNNSICPDHIVRLLAEMGQVSSTQKVDVSTGVADIPITVTREAATFSVTVPTSLPVTVAADGTVTVADNATIENNGSSAVCVKNVKVTASENWALASFDKSAMLKEAPGTKKVGLSITMGSKTAATSAAGQSEDICSYDNTDITIAAGNKLKVTYDATIPAQPNGLTQEQAASVIFTIDWAS